MVAQAVCRIFRVVVEFYFHPTHPMKIVLPSGQMECVCILQMLSTTRKTL